MNATWLTVEQVTEFEGISRMEAYRRMRPGDPNFLLWKAREDEPGRLIDARSMSWPAQERWRQELLRNAAKPPEPDKSGQLPLLPQTEIDSKIAALSLPASERDCVLRRFRVVDLCLNHNWKAQGYASRGDFLAALAQRNETSVRSIERWLSAWRQGENLLDLAPELPGPKRGAGSILNADMRAHLVRCWRIEKLTLRQCHASLVAYLEGKQNSPGCKVDQFYVIPSRTTVERFIHSLSEIDNAARKGADALKAAVGHIDRTYRDIRSLDRVDVDEWIVDAFAYDPRHVSRVGRYYALTFLDERSRLPLVWSLVEHPNEQDEIDLLCALIREFGIPGLINSDRGRFRGRTFGGRFLNRDRGEMYRERDGILDRLDIARNEPREHNPRGSRLERFHLELANWARTLPGWCGSDTKQRRATDADAQVALHKEWVRTGQGASPLLSRDELLQRLNRFMAEFRQRPSDGNDMDGFAPEAVFRRNTPAEGFRRISDADLDFKTAEHFDVLIGKGGIIQLRDGKRYSDPQLLLIQGERREVARFRHDHEQISVLPSAKGEAAIIARRRARVGTNDPDQLAAAMELQNRERKLVGQMVKPLEYDPGSFSDATTETIETEATPETSIPKATDAIHPSEFIAAQEAPAPPPDREVSSVEYTMERDTFKRKKKPMGFADLED